MTYLSSRRTSQEITDAIKSALDSNRIGFAYTLMDSILQTRVEPIGNQENQKTKNLINEVRSIYYSGDIGKKLLDSESELSDIITAETAINNLSSQIEKEYYAVVPELIGVLSEDEININYFEKI